MSKDISAIEWRCAGWEELDLNTFHDLAALRIKVFVVEQDCPYQELDGKDKDSIQLTGHLPNGEVVATLRIVPPGISYAEPAIGRVVIDPSQRGTGLGHELMHQGMLEVERLYGKVNIRLSAQTHLEKYYSTHGFVHTGKSYLEDGIPHIEMLYTASSA